MTVSNPAPIEGSFLNSVARVGRDEEEEALRSLGSSEGQGENHDCHVIRSYMACGFSPDSGVRDYLKNNSDFRSYRVHLLESWAIGTNSGSSIFIKEIGPSEMIFIGCSRSGGDPNAYYFRNIIREDPI